VFYLLGERLLLARRIQKISLRICVTGTRGKSSVTRLIASSLREAGFQVLTKTTGTVPVLVLPNGEEREIKRKGNPSLLEGKKILKIGTQQRVNALVAELMSIQPEYSFAESVQMLRPNILVITNVRLDHLAQMGSTRMEIARSLSASIPPCCTVIVPEEENFSFFKEITEGLNSNLVLVAKDSYREFLEAEKKALSYEFEENLRLALEVSDFLGIKKEFALKGIRRAQPDFGCLKIWRAEGGVPPRKFHLVSAFAANDPFSTERAISKSEERISFKRKRVIGLLNLRNDRGDRTLQWEEALKKGHFPFFHRLIFIGGHAQALKRKLNSMKKWEISLMKVESPQEIMAGLTAMEQGEMVVVGMGNMAGAGHKLLKYWEKIGKPYDF
jgi:poly-gamma-glutamate synthase PgsB/CapB